MTAGKEVKEAVVKEIPAAKVDTMELDLSSMASVRKFASEFNSSGVRATPFSLSNDSIEIQFATNHLGHFLLTNLLIDTMKKTSRKSNKEGRIVNVSSESHRFPYKEGIRSDKINDHEGYRKFNAYGQSKLANILHSNELAKRLKEKGTEITANSLHLGIITTNLFRHLLLSNSFLEGVAGWLSPYMLKNVQQGAATTCYVALHPQVKGVRGEYFSDSNLAKTIAMGKDVDMAKKLWDFSMKLIR